MNDTIIKIPVNTLYSKSFTYFCKLCHLNKDNEQSSKKIERSLKLRNKYFTNTYINVLITKLDKKFIKKDTIILGNDSVNCSILNTIDNNNIAYGYIFMFSAPNIVIKENNEINNFYLDAWQTCFIDAARDKLYDILLEHISKQNNNYYLLNSFGPGFYEMNSDSVKSFFNVLDGEKINVHLTKYGMMDPVKSIVGVHLITNKEHAIKIKDCKNCLAHHKNCEFCLRESA